MRPVKPARSLVWAAYVRESTEDQGKGFGPQVQTDFCGEIINAHEGRRATTGVVFGKVKADFDPPTWVYGDIGGHGWDIARPGLEVLLDDCAAGKVDVIVVWRQDRLARTVDVMRLILAFVSTGAQVYVEGRMYVPNESLSIKVRAMVSEEELDKMSTAISGGLQKSKSQGRRLSRDPLGFRKTADHKGYVLSDFGESLNALRARGMTDGQIAEHMIIPLWKVRRFLKNLKAHEGGTLLEMLEGQRQKMVERQEKFKAKKKENRKRIREKLEAMAPGKWE